MNSSTKDIWSNDFMNIFDMTESTDDDIMNADLSEIDESGDVSISVPGGLKETPDSKPYDAASVSIPSGTTIDAATYNRALDNLQKSFKEASEFMEALKGVQVVEKTIEQQQEEFTEAAILQSIEDGPLFEAVQKDDKDDVKNITRSIRPKVRKYAKSNNVKFKDIGVIRKLLNFWNFRIWQHVGLLYIESGNVKDFVDDMNSEFSDILGDYKLLPVTINPATYEFFTALADLIRLRFGWKNQKWVYFLVVDKKLTKDIKNDIKAIAAAADKVNKEDSKSSESDDDND